ncbi:MAG: GNAT family N-acetyltransferase [Acidimicrobiia bacterium]|nr:GNAT family N-acetyltransferase [Acidimicrobiia bacterium]
MTGSVVLRPARPDPEEGKAFACYVETAADHLFRVMFGAGAESVLARAFMTSGHDLSYEHVVFADRSGSLVGMISGYTEAAHRKSADSEIMKAAGVLRSARMLALSPLSRGLVRFMDRLDDGDFYVQAVGVDQSARGEGVGSQLLDLAEERALGASCHRLVLDVACTNTAARRLYERRGMEVVAESPAIVFVPDSSVYRMAKQL